jgi:hypothetical protein
LLQGSFAAPLDVDLKSVLVCSSRCCALDGGGGREREREVEERGGRERRRSESLIKDLKRHARLWRVNTCINLVLTSCIEFGLRFVLIFDKR